MSRVTKPPWPPWPDPPSDWPPHVVRMYREGCVRIDKARKQMEPDGICPIPFLCHMCEKTKSQLALITGDGVPMCVDCLGFVPSEEMVS